eukprot:3308133-Rhodomonas_salina.1
MLPKTQDVILSRSERLLEARLMRTLVPPDIGPKVGSMKSKIGVSTASTKTEEEVLKLISFATSTEMFPGGVSSMMQTITDADTHFAEVADPAFERQDNPEASTKPSPVTVIVFGPFVEITVGWTCSTLGARTKYRAAVLLVRWFSQSKSKRILPGEWGGVSQSKRVLEMKVPVAGVPPNEHSGCELQMFFPWTEISVPPRVSTEFGYIE